MAAMAATTKTPRTTMTIPMIAPMESFDFFFFLLEVLPPVYVYGESVALDTALPLTVRSLMLVVPLKLSVAVVRMV